MALVEQVLSNRAVTALLSSSYGAPVPAAAAAAPPPAAAAPSFTMSAAAVANLSRVSAAAGEVSLNLDSSTASSSVSARLPLRSTAAAAAAAAPAEPAQHRRTPTRRRDELRPQGRPPPAGPPVDEIRAPEERDLMDLAYGSKVVFRAASGNYLSSRAPAGAGERAAVADSQHPEAFHVANAQLASDQGTVRFDDTVLLRSAAGRYLSAESDGTVRVQRLKADSRCRWTLVRAVPGGGGGGGLAGGAASGGAPTDMGEVKVFDQLALRSCFGSFLTADAAGAVSANTSEMGAEQSLGVSPAALPRVPEWSRTRAFSLRQPEAPPGEALSSDLTVLNSYPAEVQEQLLVEDVLFALSGVQGKWILAAPGSRGGVVFEAPPGLADESMLFLVARCLPLCEHYSHVQAFVDQRSRFEYGLVNHALCAAVRVLLKEYLVLVAQLEHQFRRGRLTLQRLWFYVQPSLQTMERLWRVTSAAAAEQAIGGALLNVVHRAMQREGDAEAKGLFVHLLARASVPYMDMMRRWIYRGEVRDAYGEFQIVAREDLTKENLREDFNDTYWDERYTVRRDRLPVFFEAVADRVLIAGKYLNVVRECGLTVRCPFEAAVPYTVDHHSYAAVVDRAHGFASRTLLTLLMEKERLMERLVSIKRYFLLSQGDFFVHFMDAAGEQELRKGVPDIALSKLQSLLELAVASTSGEDPFGDDLKCGLQRFTLIQKLDAIHSSAGGVAAAAAGDEENRQQQSEEDEQKQGDKAAPGRRVLTGLEAFTLTYQVKWPLSLIISKKTLTKYQLLFRHLFYCKHVERQLSYAFLALQTTKELNLRAAFSASYCLRHRMQHFVREMVSYMAEVLETAWRRMEAEVKKAGTVDEVIRVHDAFLDQCLRECLLTSHQLLRQFSKLLMTCLLFAESIDRFTASVRRDLDRRGADTAAADRVGAGAAPGAPPSTGATLRRREAKVEEESRHVRRIATQKNYLKLVRKFEAGFDDRLRAFMGNLREKSIAQYRRLNFNEYHSAARAPAAE